MILDGTLDASVRAAAAALQRGELLGLPTETVYGLAADSDNDAAVAQIFAAKASTGGQDSVGLRCPSHPVAHAVLAACQQLNPPVWGVSAPSANKFGRVSPTTADHVAAEFGDALLVLDGGACEVGIESTIVDCTRGVPVLLRPGAITRDDIERACGGMACSVTPGTGERSALRW